MAHLLGTLGAVFAVLGLAMFMVGFGAQAITSPPVLTLTPASGAAGTGVTWAGSGFQASGSVEVEIAFTGPVPNPPTSGACAVSTTNPDEMDCHGTANGNGAVGPAVGSLVAILTGRTTLSFSMVAIDVTSGLYSNTAAFTVTGTTTTTTSSTSSTTTATVQTVTRTITQTVTQTTTLPGETETITHVTTRTSTLTTTLTTTSSSPGGRGFTDLQWGGLGFVGLGVVLVGSDAKLYGGKAKTKKGRR